MILSELKYRTKRVITIVLSIALGTMLLLLIHAITKGFQQIAGKPLELIGSSVTIQKSGNVPEKMEGAVLPCAAVALKRSEIDRIRIAAGKYPVSQSLLLWYFDHDQFYSIMGIEPHADIGPGLLKKNVTEGIFLDTVQEKSAVIDKNFAHAEGLNVEDSLFIDNKTFPIIGIVDASSLGKMVSAHVYIHLREAQQIAYESKRVQEISAFSPDDASILFLDIPHDNIKSFIADVTEIVGKSVSIISSYSMMANFKGIIAFFNSFSQLIIILVLIITTVLAGLNIYHLFTLRKQEFGIMKAVGWIPSEIQRQILKETLFYSCTGTVFGIIFFFLSLLILSSLTVSIPIPWEANAAIPHFLMNDPHQNPEIKTSFPITISLPVIVSIIAGITILSSTISILCSKKINSMKPSKVVNNG